MGHFSAYVMLSTHEDCSGSPTLARIGSHVYNAATTIATPHTIHNAMIMYSGMRILRTVKIRLY